LREADDGVELEVEDDGVGFDLEDARKRASDGRSSGLTGMRERAELLGGTCWVQAQPGSGTKIRAVLPFAA
jgi:signal transduction histidine kinase